MNGQSAIGTVSTLFTPSVARAGAHSRWLLLYGRRPRYLLVPHHNLAVQRRCVRTFRHGVGAMAGELTLGLQRLLPRWSAPLRFEAPAAARAQWLEDVPLPGLAHAAVQVGTPGPFQKASVLLLDRDGQTLGLAKVAMGARADAMVKRERLWLAWLASVESLQHRTPGLLARGRTGAGRQFLVTDLGPAERGAAQFGPAQQEFLTSLAHASVQHRPFLGSKAHRRIHTGLRRLASRTSADVMTTLQSALRDCETAMGDGTGPMVVAHGDFTPWNTRLGAHGIYVFDWEYAWKEATPAHDPLHWLLLPQALRRWGLTRRAMGAARNVLAGYLQHTFPDQPWSREQCSALLVHYLLDTMVFYGMADGTIHFSHPVQRSYYRMLEERSQWMA